MLIKISGDIITGLFAETCN